MFSQSVIEQLKYYVYFLRDPRDGKVFYVGKGKGNRIFNHAECALESESSSDKLDTIRSILSAGYKVEHYVLRHGLEEVAAFEVEAALIDFIGLTNLSNSQGGHYSSDFGIKTTDEIIAMYSAEPLDTSLPIVLININRKYYREITQEELHDATREAWVIGSKRDRATYAVATYRGLTREVYKIQSWYPVDIEGKERWGFIGELASDAVREQLRYKAISSYFPQGAANPIKYLNCDAPLSVVQTTPSQKVVQGPIDSADKNLNLIVHIQKGKEIHCYEWGTRQAWKCGEKAHRVKRVIGVVKGKIACIVDDVSAEISTPTSNPKHNAGCEGRYVFVGGKCVSEKDLCVGVHGTLMFKKISGLGQGHRYLTDEELFSRID